MKKTIELNHVSLKKGIYAVNIYGNINFVVKCEHGFAIINIEDACDGDFYIENCAETLQKLMAKYNGCKFYTLSGEQII